MKRILTLVIAVLTVGFFTTDATAQNLAGTEISTTMGLDDPAAVCSKRFGVQTGARIFRDGVSSSCPTKACPGNFNSNMNAWDEFGFKNIINQPVCITVDVNGGACQAQFTVHGHVQYGAYSPPPGMFCTLNPGFLGDQGGSGTNSMSVEVDGCTPFYTVFTNSQGQVVNCQYSFTIQPDPLLDLRCLEDTAVCIEKVKIGGTPVPTMTQWGLFLFGLIILTLGVVTIYNMSTRSASERS